MDKEQMRKGQLLGGPDHGNFVEGPDRFPTISLVKVFANGGEWAETHVCLIRGSYTWDVDHWTWREEGGLMQSSESPERAEARRRGDGVFIVGNGGQQYQVHIFLEPM